MRIQEIIARSFRSLRSAKIRTLLTALAIAVGSFVLSLTLAASNGAQHYVNRIIEDNFNPSELIVAKDEAVIGKVSTDKPVAYNPTSTISGFSSTPVARLNDSDIKKITNTPGVGSIRLGISISLLWVKSSNNQKYDATVEAFSPYQNPVLLAGSIPKPLNDQNIVIPEAFLQAFGFKSAKAAIGQKITLAVTQPVNQQTLNSLLSSPQSTIAEIEAASKPQTKTFEYTVVAVAQKPTVSQPGTDLYLYVGSNDASTLNDTATIGTSNYHEYTYVFALVNNGTNKKILDSTATSIKNEGYVTQSVADTEAFLNQIISILQGIVAAFGAIAIIASVFGIVNTMYISVLQRTREIGLMKALGMRKKDIGRLFRLEAAWIGFIGGLLGAILAYIVCYLMNPWITKKLSLNGQKLLIYNFKAVSILIVILIIIAIFAGWLPSRKASKLDPIEALRTE